MALYAHGKDSEIKKSELLSSGQVLNCYQPGDPRDQLVLVLMQWTEVSNLNKNICFTISKLIVRALSVYNKLEN